MTIKPDEYKHSYTLTDLEAMLVEALRGTERNCVCEEEGDRFEECPCDVNVAFSQVIETAYGDSMVKVHILWDEIREIYQIRIIKKAYNNGI